MISNPVFTMKLHSILSLMLFAGTARQSIAQGAVHSYDANGNLGSRGAAAAVTAWASS